MRIPTTRPIPNKRRSPTRIPRKHAARAFRNPMRPFAAAVPAKIHAASSLKNVAKKKNAKSPTVETSGALGSIKRMYSSIRIAENAAEDRYIAAMDQKSHGAENEDRYR